MEVQVSFNLDEKFCQNGQQLSQLPVRQQSTDKPPTVVRQLADKRPTVHGQSTDKQQ